MTTSTFYHQAVLLHECIEQLDIRPDGVYLDATFGGGGHSKAILSRLNEKGRLIVFDQDEDARRNLPEDSRVIFVRENFRYAHRFVRLYQLGKLNGVLADLGVSSWQFDTAERGFSIRFDAPLDMRMDQRNPVTAVNILNTYPEKKLQMLFEQYGEVTNAKTLAARIIASRDQVQMRTINELKQVIAPVMYGNPNKYLAQVFQALRIEVNDELQALKDFLKQITNALDKDGRLCIITFHSLEDRIVKQWMKNESFEESHDPFQRDTVKRQLQVVHKKPITPSDAEINQNPRARSAKLRVAQKK
ncbi:MAG: 16S rRNA (cytosine(1402)-N(4))-methyltransferase RsmH [Chitinophagaceae bacterium]|nr:16S rRNA (cytosine(1402)-N(4))-methyltransferase RsmH [Chitinophagaceae bacterium]